MSRLGLLPCAAALLVYWACIAWVLLSNTLGSGAVVLLLPEAVLCLLLVAPLLALSGGLVVAAMLQSRA